MVTSNYVVQYTWYTSFNYGCFTKTTGDSDVIEKDMQHNIKSPFSIVSFNRLISSFKVATSV